MASEEWLTSWYWRWRPIPLPEPGTPQGIPDERAEALALLLELALVPEQMEVPSCFLALGHERLLRVNEVTEVARIEYRVSLANRFPTVHAGNGLALRAREYVQHLDDTGTLSPTRGPFHLSEVLAQCGISVLTARTDLLFGDTIPRIAPFVPVAVTRGSGPFEPMHVGLWDPTGEKVHWVSDDKLSRAWHAPLAGGELLTLLPAVQMPSKSKSGSFHASVGRLNAEATRKSQSG